MAIIVTLFAFSCVAPFGLATDFSRAYQLRNEAEGNTLYRLNLVIPQHLQEHYAKESHRMTSSADFPKFVTPYAVKPIADKLRELYPADEDFANAVLMIVHQMRYKEVGPAKYPIETIIDNEGDCDLFSFAAASILKAGGLNIVLFYYQTEKHMNVGVQLPETPKNARNGVYSVNYTGLRFYMAECTGENWQNGWRVGESPDNLKKASVQAITLEDGEQIAPGQVSASFTTLKTSAISLDSPLFTLQNDTVTLGGQLTPALPNENVTFYVSINGAPWSVLDTTATQVQGRFEYSWASQTVGILAIRAGWAGNEQYAGTTSQTQTTLTIPPLWLELAGITLIAIAIAAIASLISKSKQPQPPVPPPPQPQEPQESPPQ